MATSYNPLAEVLDTPAVVSLLSVVRAKTTNQSEYVRHCDRLMNLLAEEGLARFSKSTTVETPCGVCAGSQPLDGSQVCVVDIMRSGGILLEAVRRLVPDCKTAKILIQRDEETAKPVHLYTKLPPNMAEMGAIILCDPMLATGGSATTAIKELLKAGAREEQILFLNTVSCPEGLRVLAKECPGVRILTTAIDEGLNEQKFIVPGLGDFGDRYYGTFGYKENLWGDGAAKSRL